MKVRQNSVIYSAYTVFCFVLYYVMIYYVPHSWMSGFTQQATAQLIGNPKYLRFNVLVSLSQKTRKVFTYVNVGFPFSSIILSP